MSYYGAGDYYGAGGLGSFLGGIAGRVVRGAAGFVTGGPAAAVGGFLSRPGGGGGGQGRAQPVIRTPGLGGSIQRIVPGGATGFQVGGGGKGKGTVTASGRRRYRRMQYTNMKALRRSNRRIDGFVKEVKKSLKHTNYSLVSKSSRSKGSKSTPAVIVETGAGGVRA